LRNFHWQTALEHELKIHEHDALKQDTAAFALQQTVAALQQALAARQRECEQGCAALEEEKAVSEAQKMRALQLQVQHTFICDMTHTCVT